jgi:ATP/ADP translocase
MMKVIISQLMKIVTDPIRMMDLTTGMTISCFLLFLFIFYCRTAMEDLKLIQKLRQRKNGLSSEELALGKQTNPLFSSRKSDVCLTISHEIFSFLLFTAK